MINKVVYLVNGNAVNEREFYVKLFSNIYNYNKHFDSLNTNFKLSYYLSRLDKNNIITIPITFSNRNGTITETLYENQYERIITKK